MSEGTLNGAQLARLLGVSRQAISVAARKGRIRKEPNGKFDPDVARAMWFANRKAPPPKADDASASATTGRAATEAERAKIKLERERIGLERERGELIPRAEAEATVETIGSAVQAWCQSVPARVAQRIAAETGADVRTIRAILAEEIGSLQDQLVESIG